MDRRRKSHPHADDRHSQQIETSHPSAEHAAADLEAIRREKFRVEFEHLKEVVRTKSLNGAVVKKRKGRKAAPQKTAPRKTAPRDYYQQDSNLYPGKPWNKMKLPIHFLFEFASGYALFGAPGVNDVEINFESAENYINNSNQAFTLEAFNLFSSAEDALLQMNDISDSILSKELERFLVDNLPTPVNGTSYYVGVSDPALGCNIAGITRLPVQSGLVWFNVIRGLRMKIDKFIHDLKPGDLEKAQLNLARLYSRQRCSSTYKGISMAAPPSSLPEVVVVPHRFEGIFIATSKEEDFICTKNLVPGEALYGERLISVQNKDRTEVEYRVWNPLTSKLAAAILCGVNNIWVKPGSRVLYIGDVCGITVSHLSDLVGPDGLVYVVGTSDVIVNLGEKRSNVVPIFEKCYDHWKYRMVVGMVDILISDIVSPHEATHIFTNAMTYLKAGGHYVVFTRGNNMDSTSQGSDVFSYLDREGKREFNPIELVVLDPIGNNHVMFVGGYRMLQTEQRCD